MSTATHAVPGPTPGVVPGLAKIIGFLVGVEIASGILQGYYTPIFSRGRSRAVVRVPHRVGGLLGHRPGRGGQPVRRTQRRVRGLIL